MRRTIWTLLLMLVAVLALLVSPASSGRSSTGKATSEDSRFGVAGRLQLNYNSKFCDGRLKYQLTRASQSWSRISLSREVSSSHGRFGTAGMTQCDNKTIYTQSKDISRDVFTWNLKEERRTTTYSYPVRWNYTGEPIISLERRAQTGGWVHTHVRTSDNDPLGAFCVRITLMEGPISCH